MANGSLIIRRARKTHHCADCHKTIQPGDRYVISVAFPDDPDLGNTGFWRQKLCLPCVDRYRKAGA